MYELWTLSRANYSDHFEVYIIAAFIIFHKERFGDLGNILLLFLRAVCMSVVTWMVGSQREGLKNTKHSS